MAQAREPMKDEVVPHAPISLEPLLQHHCGIADPLAWSDWAAGVLATAGRAVDPCPSELLRCFALPLVQRLVRLRSVGHRPVIGLNGPVGAGKSSLVAALRQLAPAFGIELAVASIDDFYLPWDARCQAMAGNPFAVTRVPPGSHDPSLLQQVLAAWRAGEALRLPRFDKTLQGGEGDRCGEWLQPADAVVLEGWLLGCRPLGGEGLERALEALPPQALQLSREERAWLPHWDRELAAYQPAWGLIDELWLLRPAHWHLPRRWRFQAEARQRRRLGGRPVREPQSAAAGSALGRGAGSGSGSGLGWLAPEALDRLVRSSLCSLPPALYQEPLRLRSAQRSLDQRKAMEQNAHQPAADPTAADHSKADHSKADRNKTIQLCPTAVEAELDGRRRLVAVRCRDSAFA